MATQQASAPRNVSGEQLALLLARPQTRVSFICVAMALTGGVQGSRYGWNGDALSLLVGAMFGIIGMFLYSSALMSVGRSWTAFGSGLAGFAPYLFGCYLVFIRGVWNARSLLDSFTLGSFGASAVFIYLGYRLVYWTWQLSEIGEALRSGQMVLMAKAIPT